MADYRLIMSLLLKGRSYREVVAAAGCSHRDVPAAKAAIRVHEITAGQLGVMSEDDLAGLFPDGRSRVSEQVFTSIDYEKFRTLRITHVATRFEELIADEANDELTPGQLFLTSIDDALEQRRANRIAALIRKAGFPIPTATIAELDYREGRGINPTRMRRYAAHDWSAEPVNLLINSPPVIHGSGLLHSCRSFRCGSVKLTV